MIKDNKTTKKFENNLPLYLFHQGTNYNVYDYLGAHFCTEKGKEGVVFRTWAPNAHKISVVGDFNGWDVNTHVMNRISDKGVFELFIEGIKDFDNYKFAVTHNNKTVFKADPYAFHAETPSGTASKVYNLDGYDWGDDNYLNDKKSPYSQPLNIYEVNLASWKRKQNGDYYSYRELSKELVDYVEKQGYTCVEFMPISEYPFDGSWGYQVTGYYSPSSRFGAPKDFMHLVDCFHKKGIKVIVDWVPAHFPKDDFGLFEFDGTPCYENQGWDRKEHKTWGTRIFDLGREEVQSFLISNAVFLFEKYHVDGLRVDAVSSMLYLDYDKKDGEWIPNKDGGNYNLESIAFLKKLNTIIFEKFPNALMIAEESTAFPLITKPVSIGGLGFNFKWNMGWMNDTLSYMTCDPYFRASEHNKLTFSLTYAFNENYVLPISHDEVVHGKKSLLDKMNAHNIEDKFASLRAFWLYMYAHPGKKLSFMGNEYGQFREWDYQNGLEFFMLNFELHNKLYKYNRKLNHIYKEYSQFYQIDDSWEGFEWISVDERDNNLIAFKRKNLAGEQLLAIVNFSGNDYPKYRLGVDKGCYKALLCSDDKRFGGRGILKRKTIKSVKKTAHGKEHSILISLPRFSGIYFIKKDKF